MTRFEVEHGQQSNETWKELCSSNINTNINISQSVWIMAHLLKTK
jgi:hypothetical protein